MWKDNAVIVETVYSGYVDWEERFYLCPECGEPIYEEDWETNYLLCPIFGFNEED